MSYGTGVLQPMSKEQKMNVRSSTEAETTGVLDYLPKNLWTQMCMKHQMLPVRCAPYYQDNMSAEKIEKNGWKSVGSWSRHIDIKTFFVTDRHKKGDIDIKHCPSTSEMVADYFTKPLQGALFQDMRNVIMGYKSYISLQKYANTDEQSEEHVENVIKLQTDVSDTKTEFGAKSYCTHDRWKQVYCRREKIKFYSSRLSISSSLIHVKRHRDTSQKDQIYNTIVYQLIGS
jgi:hypothetical protein